MKLGIVPFALLLLTLCREDPLTVGQSGMVPSEALSITLAPQPHQVVSGDSVQFSAILRDPSGNVVIGLIEWVAVGGTIDHDGMFVAGDMPTAYEVVARHRTREKVLVAIAAGQVVKTSEVPGLGIAADGFESADFRKWGSNVPLGNPCAQGSFNGGSHIGDGCITSERAHSGKYSWRAEVDPTTDPLSGHPATKSYLSRWRITDGVTHSVSAWYFIPADYPAIKYVNLMQWKERTGSHNPTFVVALNRDGRLWLQDWYNNSSTVALGPEIPKGRWVNIKTLFVPHHSAGRIATWLDGRLLWDVSGLNTLGRQDNANVYFGVGNYTAGSLVKSHIYIDDVQVETD